MFWKLRKKLFGTRFAIFKFGHVYKIRKIEILPGYNKEFCMCYDYVIKSDDKSREWKEL